MTGGIYVARSGDGRTALTMTCPKCGETVGWILTDGVAKKCLCPKCAEWVATFDGDGFTVLAGDRAGDRDR